MQNFTTTPTQPKSLVATIVHADGTPDTTLSAPITWSLDSPTLFTLQTNGIGWAPGQIQLTPIQPAAQAGGVTTVTGKFTNENGVLCSTSFTVTIVVNPNPGTGLLMA